MIDKLLFGAQEPLKRALDASWARNEVITQNIANVDTPGYKRKDVIFSDFLDSEMKTSRINRGLTPISGSGSGFTISEDSSGTSYRADGNNVDIERESAAEAMNSLRYNVLIQRMTGSLNSLRNVIRGGK